MAAIAANRLFTAHDMEFLTETLDKIEPAVDISLIAAWAEK